MNLNDKIKIEREIQRLEGLIEQYLEQLAHFVGYEVNIAEANVIYYTLQFNNPNNKHEIKAYIDTIEQYYREITRQKRKKKIGV